MRLIKLNILACLITFSGFLYAGGVHKHEPNSYLIIKAGNASLTEEDQTVLFSPLDFDKNTGAYGVEFEFGIQKDLKYSLEIMGYTHDYSSFGSPGDLSTTLVMFNVKKFLSTKALRPFIGAGIGASIAELDGPIFGDADGTAFQVFAGFTYQTNSNIGIQAEVKWIKADNEDDVGTSIDSSSIGVFLGVRIPFGQ